ncbi:low-density lipoprotein receptor-like [Ptychodera flava]|uniref:low-density lipoprotein receptor-like n=1 Tax=Ptychodera flava TaxID=63121 RepID=UPI00396A40FB
MTPLSVTTTVITLPDPSTVPVLMDIYCSPTARHADQCIPNRWICDYWWDCADDEGEALCGVCDKQQFTCGDLSCIPNFWVCDDEHDCPTGEDEGLCEDYYRCDDGKCIHEYWKCDGEMDCLDGDDEDGCQVFTCAEDYYRCDDGKCIRESWKCDGETDCTDGDDEDGCRDICTPNQYLCYSGACISDEGRCNSTQDCELGEDEIDCSGENNNLATGKPARQSSDLDARGVASHAVDGDKYGNFFRNSCSHTQSDFEPWWKVDLLMTYRIIRVHIVNRDDCCYDRLIGAVVRAGNDEDHLQNPICGEPIGLDNRGEIVINCPGRMLGRYVSVDFLIAWTRCRFAKPKFTDKI